MNLKNFIFLLFSSLGLITFNSCKKEIPVDYPYGNYSPGSIGSSWSYSDSAFTDSFTISETGITSERFGKTYFIQKKEKYSVISYKYRVQVGGHYYTIERDPLNDDDYEICYLNTDAEVGDTWENEVSGSMGSVWKYKIIEKKSIRVVNGITYTNVIHVQKTNNSIIDDFYYSFNVGLIESHYGYYNLTYKLRSYTIK